MEEKKEVKMKEAIDWTSIKLNSVCLLGLFTGSTLIAFLTGIATASTILYNGIKIYQELKKKKKI